MTWRSRESRARVAAATWEAFRLTNFEECTGAEVSQLLGMPVASVFVAKHRVQKILKEEIHKLERAIENDGDGFLRRPADQPP